MFVHLFNIRVIVKSSSIDLFSFHSVDVFREYLIQTLNSYFGKSEFVNEALFSTERVEDQISYISPSRRVLSPWLTVGRRN